MILGKKKPVSKKLGLVGLLGTALIATATLAYVAPPAAEAAAPAVRFASYNVYGPPTTGTREWAKRRPHVAGAIQAVNPDVLGVQEARKGDANGTYIYEQLTSDLSGTYSSVPIDATYLSKVRSPQMIYYRTSKFTVMDVGHWIYGMSGQPAACNTDAVYSMTWARLQDKGTGERYFVVSTHLTANGADGTSCSNTRVEEVTQLKNRIAVLMRDNDWTTPIVVLGDFNSAPAGAPIDLMKVERSWPMPNGTTRSFKLGYGNTIPTVNAGWHDGSGSTGPATTSTDDTTIIDYVWYQPSRLSRTGTSVNRSMVDIDGDVRSPSDHYLIWADLAVD